MPISHRPYIWAILIMRLSRARNITAKTHQLPGHSQNSIETRNTGTHRSSVAEARACASGPEPNEGIGLTYR